MTTYPAYDDASSDSSIKIKASGCVKAENSAFQGDFDMQCKDSDRSSARKPVIINSS
jgi:hypothetical protein